MKIEVIKRDGSLEDFQAEKIARVVEAAGLRTEAAQNLAKKVADWAKEWMITKRQDKITTLEIRVKVIEELHRVNEYVANLFAWYQKTKDHNSVQ